VFKPLNHPHYWSPLTRLYVMQPTSSLMLKPNGQGLYMLPVPQISTGYVLPYIMQLYTLTTFIGHFNGYLLGYRGYLCLPYLMTPYPEPEPGPQAQFNLAHSRTRVKWKWP